MSYDTRNIMDGLLQALRKENAMAELEGTNRIQTPAEPVGRVQQVQQVSEASRVETSQEYKEKLMLAQISALKDPAPPRRGRFAGETKQDKFNMDAARDTPEVRERLAQEEESVSVQKAAAAARYKEENRSTLDRVIRSFSTEGSNLDALSRLRLALEAFQAPKNRKSSGPASIAGVRG